ncbi:TrkA family potassium uptake protein [Citricoccus sp. NPDC079358]|uniref:Trk system potassium uptake protein TrkA n=4 Tax=Citricoccus TaxID=169133 RepID=A0A3D9LBQ8_9MICC|nr:MULTISPECIES: TrkA family potassium uptake protein [Citricoccus]REE03300.1 trk system potassium uptake protein TrkA [Citricoccus muralis]GGO46779.1 potassium transporter TrkA [Citricoccus zhacaiensis]
MKVVIAGAGAVGSSIARELLANGHEVLLVDTKPEVVARSGLRGVKWLMGDACELTVLQEAHLETAEVLVAATGDDKANLVVSLLAKSEFGVGRTVARVNNPKNDWLFDEAWGVDVAVSTPRIMTALVEEAVETGDLVRLLTLKSGQTTLVEFTVPAGHWADGRRLGSVSWPEDISVVSIIRDTRPITPSDDDVMEAGDELFFLATEEAESRLRDVLVPEDERQARGQRESLSQRETRG